MIVDFYFCYDFYRGSNSHLTVVQSATNHARNTFKNSRHQNVTKTESIQIEKKPSQTLLSLLNLVNLVPHRIPLPYLKHACQGVHKSFIEAGVSESSLDYTEIARTTLKIIKDETKQYPTLINDVSILLDEIKGTCVNLRTSGGRSLTTMILENARNNLVLRGRHRGDDILTGFC